MTKTEHTPENLRAIVDNMKKYRRRALIYGVIAVVLLLIAAALTPAIKAYAARTFDLWPSAVRRLALVIPAYILGTLCVLSALSAMWNLGFRNRTVRRVCLVLGIVLGAVYIYLCSALFIHTLPCPSSTLWKIILNPFYYPILFVLPVGLIYLGLVKA